MQLCKTLFQKYLKDFKVFWESFLNAHRNEYSKVGI